MSQEFAGADLKLGQANALVKILGGMEVVMSLLQGTAKAVIQIVRHIIDCDANPYVPKEWKVEKHKKGGKLEWDPTKIQLYLSKQQEGDKYIEGNKLRKELEDQPVLNANVLDYLLAHPELIADTLKGKYVFFWGTIYRSSDGHLYVRCLCWRGGSWDWSFIWLGYGFLSLNPAAVASK